MVSIREAIEDCAPAGKLANQDHPPRMLRVGAEGTVAGADTATALEHRQEPIGLNDQ